MEEQKSMLIKENAIDIDTYRSLVIAQIESLNKRIKSIRSKYAFNSTKRNKELSQMFKLGDLLIENGSPMKYVGTLYYVIDESKLIASFEDTKDKKIEVIGI